MTDMPKTIEDLYAKRLTEYTDPAERDLAQLDQGAFGCDLRYKELAGRFKWKGAKVLDLGVGTGSMYEAMVGHGAGIPSLIHGVDMMPEREAEFTPRMTALGVQNVLFACKPSSVPFDQLDVKPNYDLVMCIGIIGYHGLHTVAAFKRLYDFCRWAAPHGAIFLPTVYGVEGMGDSHVQRFDLEDIHTFVEGPGDGLNAVQSGRDHLLIW